MKKIFDQIITAVKAGEEEDTVRVVKEALDGNIPAKEILEKAMIPAMDDVGSRFASGEAFIPELIVAAKAMEEGMTELKKQMDEGIRNKGLVVLGTVEGDIHSIGKNLVKMCLEGAGYDVFDIGENVKVQRFVDVYKEKNPGILGVSALLSSTMQAMRKIVSGVRDVDPAAKILVGGAPVNHDFADEIGATGYAPNAFAAVKKIDEILGSG